MKIALSLLFMLIALGFVSCAGPNKEVISQKAQVKVKARPKSIIVKDPFLYVWQNKMGHADGMRRFFLDFNSDGRKEVFISPNISRKKGGSTFYIFQYIGNKKYRLLSSVYLEPGLFNLKRRKDNSTFPTMEMILNLKEEEKGRIVRRYDWVPSKKTYVLKKSIKFSSMKAAVRYLKPLSILVERTNKYVARNAKNRRPAAGQK